LNGALYYIDWTDIRVGANDPSGLNFTANGPGADIYGLELEMYYGPTENFGITATAALTSTELSEEDVDPVLEGLGVPYPDNLTLAPKGEELPGIPERTFSLTMNYNVPNLFGTFDGYGRLDSTYTSGSYNTYAQGQFSFGRARMDAYAITSLRLGVANDRGLDVSLYVKNLADERADLFIDQGSTGPQSVLRNRPRTIGLNVRKHFN
jgi:outer membrane receptor protein involved in Fe transport